MTAEQVSLLDTGDMKVCDWWVVYHPRVPHFFWAKWLKQGFRHVELARSLRFGPGVNDVVWLHVLPTFEMLEAEVSTDPRPPWVRCPGSTVQKVTAIRPLWSVRSWFDIGPTSCVEVVKMALGIRAFFVRTPWQLFNYIQKRGGVVISGRRRWWLRRSYAAAATAADAAGCHDSEPQS